MTMIKRDNFFTIQAFMVIDLGLSGNELFIYAIIYGFSQDGESFFKGSRQYLADWCNTSISSVKRALKSLQDRGLIEQIYHSVDNTEVHYVAYTEPRVKMTQGAGVKMNLGSGQNEPRVGSKVTKARVKMTQPINDDNIEDNIAENIADIRVCDTTPRPRFQKPTIEAVKTFAERKGKAVIDPERFYNYYEANGWKVGKNPMKDWRAAFRMWEAREKKDGAPSGSGKASNVPFMENEYTKEHLAQKEADSLAELDKLLGED